VSVIETERLLLEPLDVSRLEECVALTADPETMRYWWPGGRFTPSAWGQGCATEAGGAIRDEAFEWLSLESIVAVHHPENAASGRIMEKLGMSFERELVDRVGWLYRLYRLTQDQWAASR
jgi:RimJ/RimL family protein N-acetyltransferase